MFKTNNNNKDKKKGERQDKIKEERHENRIILLY